MLTKLKKLHVRNLPLEYSAADLEDLFTTVGNVISVEMRVVGYDHHAHVEMSNEQEAADCIERFHGYPVEGRALIVSEDRPHVPQKKKVTKRSQVVTAKKGPDAQSKAVGASIRAAILASRK